MNEGAQLRSGIIGQASKESGVDVRRVDVIFEQHNNEALSKLEQSKEFFPVRTSIPQKPLVHTVHRDDVLTKEMFIILRRSLSPSARALVNTAQLTEDLLRTYNKVIDAAGADGYEVSQDVLLRLSRGGPDIFYFIFYCSSNNTMRKGVVQLNEVVRTLQEKISTMMTK